MARTKALQTTCELNDIIFPVELRDNPRNTNSEYSKVVTGIIDGEEKDLNYCSPIYELVPNTSIFPVVEDILRKEKIAFTSQYSHTNNARFYGKYLIEDPRFAYTMEGTNDKIHFMWDFQHSYNGLTKYKGMAGFYRLVCTNGLVIPVQEMKEFNLVIEGKHTQAILHSLQEFQGIIQNMIASVDTIKTSITDKYEMLGGRMVVKVEDRIKEVLNVAGITAVDNSKYNTVNDILARINNEAKGVKQDIGYNGRVTDWLVYNGVNQYIFDGERNNNSPEKRRELDSKVLEHMLMYEPA